MKEVVVAIAGLWIAVLLHAWATRFVIVPLAGTEYPFVNHAHLVNRMTGDVYFVSESRVSGPLEYRPRTQKTAP